jgi:triosephosphate isomerase
MDFIVAGNWKMHKSPQETRDFFLEFGAFEHPEAVRSLFFVPAVNAAETGQHKVLWGPQNIFPAREGAFTGETSPFVMASLGASYVLVGHSERRQLFAETDEHTNIKIQSAQEFGLSPVLCVGETLEERRQGQTLDVLQRQLITALSNVEPTKELHIAYEPVWAIGTGEVATVKQVSEAHQFIRKFLQEKFPKHQNDMAILYGGSVKPINAAELAQASEVGGFLVGGASLKPQSFFEIIKACRG